MSRTLKKAPKKALKVIALKSQDSKETEQIMKVQSTVPVQANPTPDGMIALALQSGRTMEDIGKLIDHRNAEIARLARLKFIESKKNFSVLRDRIVKSNPADFGETKSGRQGAKYFFEDLDAIEKVVKAPAGECGLTYDWKTRYDDKYIYIKCILTHTAGHSEEDEMRGHADTSGGKNPIQAEASTVSYLMRYTLKHVLGLSTGKDDDDGHGSAPARAEQQQASGGIPIPSDAQFKDVVQKVIAKVINLEEALKLYSYSVEQVETLQIAGA